MEYLNSFIPRAKRHQRLGLLVFIPPIILMFIAMLLIPSQASGVVRGVNRTSNYHIYDDGSFQYDVIINFFNDSTEALTWTGQWYIFTSDTSSVYLTGGHWTDGFVPYTGPDPWQPGVVRNGYTRYYAADIGAMGTITLTFGYSGPSEFWSFGGSNGTFYGDGWGGAQTPYEMFTVNLTLPASATDFSIINESSSHHVINTSPITLRWIEYGVNGVIDNLYFHGPNLTTATISGTVVDQTTHLPINNAEVVIAAINTTALSDISGHFSVLAVPNISYSIDFSATGYLPKRISGIAHPNQDTDIGIVQLVPSVEEYYDLVELAPNPNPEISEIEHGGTVTRYYQVVGKNYRTPTNNIEVEFQTTNGFLTKTFTSGRYCDIDGVIQAAFTTGDLGCNSCYVPFKVKRINMTNNPGSPIRFSVHVTPREYNKDFQLSRDLQVGAGIALGGDASVQVGDNTTAQLSLVEKDGNTSTPENLGIIEEFESRAGVEVGAGIGAKLTVGPVNVGAYGGVSGGGYVTMEGKGEYLYNYNSASNNEEARAKLQNLALAVISINPNPVFSRVAFLLSTVANWNYLQNVGGGIGIKRECSGEAFAGIFSQRKLGLGAGVGAFGSYEGGGKLNYTYDRTEDVHRGSLSIFSSTEGNIGLSCLSWGYSGPGNPNFKRVNKIQKKASVFDLPFISWKMYREANITLGTNYYGFENTSETSEWRRTFSFNIESNGLEPYLAVSYLKGLYSLANPSSLFQPVPELGVNFLNNANDALLKTIGDRQENGALPPIEYEIDSSRIAVTGGLSVGFDWAIDIHLNLGLGYDWLLSHTAKKEQGVFLGGNEYALQAYTDVPEVETSIPSAAWKILSDGFSTFSLIDFAESICLICPSVLPQQSRADSTIVISTIGSTIRLDPSALPPGISSLSCQSWNWYGNSTLQRISDLPLKTRPAAQAIKAQQQALAHLNYGIGGFYKFSPQSIPLNKPATLVIVYPDSDVVGIDEHNLAVYCQDTLTSKWRYLGGTVDVSNNRISVQVDTLQIYTIAPIQPDGGIGLRMDADSLVNDGASVATIDADNLKLSNGNPVGDGELYTVRAENAIVTTADASPAIEGLQIPAINAALHFQVRSTQHAGPAKVVVESIGGGSQGIARLKIVDTTTPAPPVIRQIIAGDGQLTLIVSRSDSDVTQYEVNYGTVPGPPYAGTALPGGQNSPYFVSAADTIIVAGLRNGTLYHLSLRCLDVGGHESNYSMENSALPRDTIPPAPISAMNFTRMLDSQYLAQWTASGDNWTVGTAEAYDVRISTQPVADTVTWWSTASPVTGITAPGDAGTTDYHVLTGIPEDSTVYLGIKVLDEEGNGSAIAIFRIAENHVTRTMELRTGWNLVSFPLGWEGNSVGGLFPYVQGQVFQYDSRYTVSDSMEKLRGYWIKIGTPYRKDFVGVPLNDTLAQVHAGWNMVGARAWPTPVAAIYSIPAGIRMSNAFWYDTLGYRMADTIRAGLGYWIKVSQDGWIVLPKKATVLAKPHLENLPEKGFLVRLDRTILKTCLLVKDNLVGYYPAPPLPPDGCPDVRFGNESYAADEADIRYEIRISGGKYPISISMFRLSHDQFEVIGGGTGRVYGVLGEKKDVIVRDPEDRVLVLRRLALPQEYGLSQNYPNPFNPITTIDFQLPVSSMVTLKVYNVLGQVVKVLYDGLQQAGYHSVTWSGNDIASGAYFYRIDAVSVGDAGRAYANVKKMILLK